MINDQPFATVPYTVHLNDIASFDFPGFNPAAYEQQLIDEFDQLCADGTHRRRMMVIGLHERISGHASRVRVLDRIFGRLRDRDGVWWARKDQIARWALDHPDTTSWVERDPAPVTGCPAAAPDYAPEGGPVRPRRSQRPWPGWAVQSPSASTT